MKRYEKYKDSGVEWVGEIPEGWEHYRYKNIITLEQGAAFKSSEYVSNSNVVNVRMGNIKKEGKIDLEHNVRYLPTTYKKSHAKYELFENDLIIAMTDMSPSLEFLAVPAFMEGLDKETAYLLNQRVGKINSKEQFEVRYIKYLLLSYELREQLKAIGLGTVQSNMSSDDLYNSLLVAPLKPEQTAIANYLDRKTSEIDQLIVQKERLLSLYEEEKTAIINQAVTQGINPDVKLKESGIDWLGDIPEHWEVKKLKYLTTVLNDGTHGSFTRTIHGYRLLSVRNIKGDSFNFRDDDSRISETDFLNIIKPFKVLENDIQLAIVGATLGKVAIVPKLDEEFATQRSVATIRCNENRIKTKFQFYFFKSDFFQSYLWFNAGFSAQPGVYLGTLENSRIPIPAIIDQATIVQHIETEIARVSAKITKTKKIISLQKEYRTALISEVVTGKIRVTQEMAL